jgi:hypothetical protein
MKARVVRPRSHGVRRRDGVSSRQRPKAVDSRVKPAQTMSTQEAMSYAIANIDPKLLTGPITFD